MSYPPLSPTCSLVTDPNRDHAVEAIDSVSNSMPVERTLARIHASRNASALAQAFENFEQAALNVKHTIASLAGGDGMLGLNYWRITTHLSRARHYRRFSSAS